MATKRKPKNPGWGFGPVAKRLYWPSDKLTGAERAAGWSACEAWKTCDDIAPGFVRGFPHSHKEAPL
jgi:hypothetical protein